MTGTAAEVVDWVVGDTLRHRGTPTALRATCGLCKGHWQHPWLTTNRCSRSGVDAQPPCGSWYSPFHRYSSTRGDNNPLLMPSGVGRRCQLAPELSLVRQDTFLMRSTVGGQFSGHCRPTGYTPKYRVGNWKTSSLHIGTP